MSVFTTHDSEDWQRPGVDAIVRNATPRPDDANGAVVLMHDAGGDRSETVAGLDRYIPMMLAKGYRFTTVTAALGEPPADAPASAQNRRTGAVLLGVLSFATGFVEALRWILLVVGALVLARLVLMVAAARRTARRRRAPDWSWGDPVDWPVSVIVPAYNEAANIAATVRSIVANDHPLEVVVVDDGSSDGTVAIVESLGFAEVRVLRQANAGKAVALNTGIRAARHDLVIMIDGDTIFEADTVRRLVQPFADPSVGAVAGNVKIANRDDLIGRLQHVEYVVGFNIDRRVQDTLGSIATIPGAAGAFRRRALLDVGSLSTDTLAEDTDLTIALGRAGWRVVFEDTARAWTEAPATIAQLWRQRFRWSYGTMQAIWKHRRAVRERGMAGKLGRRGLVHVAAFHIALPLTAPVVDVLLVYGLLFEDAGAALVLWLAMLVAQLVAALIAFRLEGERLGALWVLPVQQVVYRQLMYLVLIQSVISAVTGARVRWQRMHRVGVLGQMLPAVARAAVPAPRRPVARRPVAPPPPVPKRASGGGRRERWLDTLRAAALVRVIVYHATSAAWLSVVFPSMGVMFALGGSLMVASLRRTPAIDVIGHRLRRLLPPLWLMGAVLVPLMLWQGWGADSGDDALSPPDLVFWLFPLLDPPGSAAAVDATVVLWYIRAYLWFVLLTPAMLAAFRRWPVRAHARAAGRRRARRGARVGPGVERGLRARPAGLLHVRDVLDARLRAPRRQAPRDATRRARRGGGGRTGRRRRVDVVASGPRRGLRPRGDPARPGAGLGGRGAAVPAGRPDARVDGPGARPRAVPGHRQRARGHDLPHPQHRHRRGRAARRGAGLDRHARPGGHGGRAGRPRGARVRLGGGPRRTQAGAAGARGAAVDAPTRARGLRDPRGAADGGAADTRPAIGGVGRGVGRRADPGAARSRGTAADRSPALAACFPAPAAARRRPASGRPPGRRGAATRLARPAGAETTPRRPVPGSARRAGDRRAADGPAPRAAATAGRAVGGSSMTARLAAVSRGGRPGVGGGLRRGHRAAAARPARDRPPSDDPARVDAGHRDPDPHVGAHLTRARRHRHPARDVPGRWS